MKKVTAEQTNPYQAQFPETLRLSVCGLRSYIEDFQLFPHKKKVAVELRSAIEDFENTARLVDTAAFKPGSPEEVGEVQMWMELGKQSAVYAHSLLEGTPVPFLLGIKGGRQ